MGLEQFTQSSIASLNPPPMMAIPNAPTTSNFSALGVRPALAPNTANIDGSLTIQDSVKAADSKDIFGRPVDGKTDPYAKDSFGRPLQKDAHLDPSNLIALFYNTVLKSNWKQAMSPRNKYRGLWTSPQADRASLALVDTLNTTMLYIDNVGMPKVTLTGNKTIDDGRGVYHIQGDSIRSTGNGTVIITFRETQVPLIELVIDPWLAINSKPFNRPIAVNFYVQMISDIDGNTSLIDYLITGVRPLSYRTPEADYGHKSVMLRDVEFACSGIRPDIMKDVIVSLTGPTQTTFTDIGTTAAVMAVQPKKPTVTSAGLFKKLYNAIAGT